MDIRELPDMSPLSPQALWIHIKQIPHPHLTVITRDALILPVALGTGQMPQPQLKCQAL